MQLHRESSETSPSPSRPPPSSPPASGLTAPVESQAARPARIAGKPNLNGIWQALNTANYDILSHQAKAALAFRPGPVVPVPAAPVLAFGAVGAVPAGNGIVEGDEIPYLPEAAKKQKENQANWLDRDPEIKCYLPGVPRANYMPMPFQILHSDKAVFFAYEYAGAVRNILLKDPGPAPVDSWMGQSVGVWEGDTFVVTVTGFNDQSWFDRAGNHHSDKLKVVERYTPQGPDHLWYESDHRRSGRRSAGRGRCGCRCIGTSIPTRGSISSSASSSSKS